MACERNLAIFSNVPFSCAAYPFTVSTRLGIKSCRLFSCTSMSDQAESQRTLNCTRLLYIPISTTAITTRITRKMMPVMGVLNHPKDEPEFHGTLTHRGLTGKREPAVVLCILR